MRNIKTAPFIAMILMTVLSFTTLTSQNLGSYVIFIGIIAYFVNKLIEKQSTKDSGLDFKAIGHNLKDRKVWIWLALPFVMDAICIIIASFVLPEYIEYEIARAGNYVTFDKTFIMIVQFAVFALGEEIAWRAFFQNQLCKIMEITPVLFISSALFALGHLTQGNIMVVAYNLFFIFINSILYGIIYHKTKNAWVSAISHYASNLFCVIIMIGF